MNTDIIFPDDIIDDRTEDKIEQVEVQKKRASVRMEKINRLSEAPIEVILPKEDNDFKPKKKLCGRDLRKKGLIKKCREKNGNCPYHICDDCKANGLDSSQCIHKPLHDFDIVMSRYNRDSAADRFYELQFMTYLTLETVLDRIDSKHKVNGLTEKFESKKEYYKSVLGDIYDDMGPEFMDQFLNPVALWGLGTFADISSSLVENKIANEKKMD